MVNAEGPCDQAGSGLSVARISETISSENRGAREMYLRKRLLEIRERLGPISRELGLRHTLGRGHDDDLVLYFDRRDGSGIRWQSPTCFIFPPASVTGEDEITWKNVLIELDETVVFPVGTNGWTFYEHDFLSCQGSPVAPNGTTDEVDEAFEDAAENLRNQALAPKGGVILPFIVSDKDIGELWQFLEPECRRRDIDRVHVVRKTHGQEVYAFEYVGRTFEIAYTDGQAFLFEDGQMVQPVGLTYDPIDASEALGDALGAISAGTILRREP
jgi:hypothetical protein